MMVCSHLYQLMLTDQPSVVTWGQAHTEEGCYQNNKILCSTKYISLQSRLETHDLLENFLYLSIICMIVPYHLVTSPHQVTRMVSWSSQYPGGVSLTNSLDHRAPTPGVEWEEWEEECPRGLPAATWQVTAQPAGHHHRSATNSNVYLQTSKGFPSLRSSFSSHLENSHKCQIQIIFMTWLFKKLPIDTLCEQTRLWLSFITKKPRNKAS